MRVHCNEEEGCGYTWMFTPRVRSTKLKRSYIVKCPKCGAPVFKRKKRHHKTPSKNPTPLDKGEITI